MLQWTFWLGQNVTVDVVNLDVSSRHRWTLPVFIVEDSYDQDLIYHGIIPSVWEKAGVSMDFTWHYSDVAEENYDQDELYCRYL